MTRGRSLAAGYARHISEAFVHLVSTIYLDSILISWTLSEFLQLDIADQSMINIDLFSPL